MKLTIENTDKIVTLVNNGTEMPARVWLGHTEGGVRCHVFVTRVAVKEGQSAEAYAQFERELKETAKPTPDDIRIIPLRFII